MIAIVTTEEVEVIEHAVPQLTPSTAAVAVIRKSTVLHVHNGIVARNTAAVTARVPQLRRASTTKMRMSMATESQSRARDGSTGAIKTSTVTSHEIGTVSETGATARIERKTSITNATRTDRETKTEKRGAVVTVKLRSTSAIMTTIGIAHLERAARIVTGRTETEMTETVTIGARTVVIPRSIVQQRMMWSVR